MKKILSAFVMTLLLSGISFANETVYGFIYKNATEAGEGLATAQANKQGQAICTSYFGIVGLGECGIKDAAKKGGIKTVAYYDIHTKNILGFKKVTTTVYGQ